MTTNEAPRPQNASQDSPPAWYLPVGEAMPRQRAELIVATFSEEARRVGRDLVARMEAHRPNVAIRRKLLSVDELMRYGQNPRIEGEWALHLGHASFSDSSDWRSCSILLEWETGHILAAGEWW